MKLQVYNPLIRRICLILLFRSCLIQMKAQNYNLDSLLTSLNTDLHDTVRIKTYQRISVTLMRKGETKKALSYAEKSLALSTRLGYKKGIAASYNTFGNIYSESSDYAKALEYHHKNLAISEETNNIKGIATAYNNIGIIYYNLSDFIKAIEYMQKGMKLQEQLGNRYFIAASIGNIAVMYSKLGEDSLALVYQKKSFAIHKEMGNKIDMIASLNHLGSLYRMKQEFASSKQYLDQALSIANEMDDLRGKAETHGNIGLLYYDEGKYNEAIVEFEQGLAVSKQLGEKKFQTEQLNMLGNTNKALKKSDVALQYYKTAYEIAKETGSLEDQQSSAEGMYETYKAADNTKEALHYHEILTQLKDSIFNATKNTTFSNLKMQFALDRQEHELKSEAEAELKKKDIEKKQQRFIGYIMIAVLIIVLLFSYFLFQRFRITNAQNKIIEEQKTVVEQKNKEVTDSILYAKRIQRTLLAHDAFLKQNLLEHFVLYKPKDIVSGDFYWATLAANTEQFYLAVCDSTGHGVPGAFMSLLNISFLNEAINEKKLYLPEQIFNHVRERLIGGISLEGAKDGMDGILLCLDKKSKTLTYAAAQNKSILIRNSEIIELKYDKMPIGLGENNNSFTRQSIELETNDILYIFTDGYADQFGGDKGKKFKYKMLKELLLQHHQEPLDQQREILEKALESWRGNLEQVDDVCVIGVRV